MTKKQVQHKINKVVGELESLTYNFHDENNKVFFEQLILSCTLTASDLYDVVERDDALKKATD
tara:strand:+ start:252 stop:440 length:189 start_codon:yes stop_codon:yes gene_type:complete